MPKSKFPALTPNAIFCFRRRKKLSIKGADSNPVENRRRKAIVMSKGPTRANNGKEAKVKRDVLCQEVVLKTFTHRSA